MTTPRFVLCPSVLLLLAVGLLAGCTTPTAYQSAALPDDYGYREQRLGDNRFRILFLANHLTTPESLDNYLLYRAAELTLEQGFDYFIVTARGLGPVAEGRGARVYPSVYGGYGSNGFDLGVGVGFGIANWGYTRQQRGMADILMQQGGFPAMDRSAYDPRAILRYLGPVVVPDVEAAIAPSM